MPEHEARTDQLVDGKEVELFAQHAVIAALGFFQACEVRGQIFLGSEGRSVHALKLLVVLVATPIGTGERQHLESLDLPGALDVRTCAHVYEIPVLKERDLLALGNAANDLDLVALALALEHRQRLLARDNLAHERQVLRDDLGHLGLDALDVLGRERLGIEVVVEAVFDGGADGHLGIGAQAANGIGHHV